MNRALLPAILGASLMLLLVSPTWSRPSGDAEQLSRPLPTAFNQTKVLIYPAVSFAALASPDGSVKEDQGALERAVLEQLKSYANLRIYSPDTVRVGVRKRKGYDMNRAEALERARWGQESYSQVRLPSAIKKLKSALMLLIEIEYHLENPLAVAQIALTLGQALLEAGQVSEAADAFKHALVLQPTLRMRRDYDRPDAIKAFEQARRGLAKAGDAPERRDALADLSVKRANIRTSIRTYLLPQEIVAVIRTPQGRQIERQAISDDHVGDASRIASRIFATLPFGYLSRARQTKSLFIDTGFSGFTYATSPVGAFPHFGLQTNATFVVAEKLSLEGTLQLGSSARDRHEHLRKNLNTVRARVAAGLHSTWGRWSGFAHFGLQVDYQSEVVITTTVACKYFTPSDDVPPTLCDFDDDFDRSDGTWSVGGGVSIGARFRVLDPIFLVIRVSGAAYAFQTEPTDFAWPVGASFALAYQLY